MKVGNQTKQERVKPEYGVVNIMKLRDYMNFEISVTPRELQ